MKACVGASERFFVFSLSFPFSFEGISFCPKEGREKCERTSSVNGQSKLVCRGKNV